MSKKLKALLLCAGFGTRLRPITNKIPKCLVKVNETTILENWLNKLENAGFSEVLINTHYLHNKVSDYLLSRKKSKIKIEVTYEEKLLGTAGTLIKNQEFFRDSKIALIHSDNMTNFKIRELIKADAYRPDNCLLTMLTFTTDTPESCGIVVCDHNNILREFYEKNLDPPSNIANAAIYVFDNILLDLLVKKYCHFKDFSKEVIPILIGKIFTYYTKEKLIDIGTPESLMKAKKIFN